jgi:hypothetical protein
MKSIHLLDEYHDRRLGIKFNTSTTRWNIDIPLMIQESATGVGTSREYKPCIFEIEKGRNHRNEIKENHHP